MCDTSILSLKCDVEDFFSSRSGAWGSSGVINGPATFHLGESGRDEIGVSANTYFDKKNVTLKWKLFLKMYNNCSQ